MVANDEVRALFYQREIAQLIYKEAVSLTSKLCFDI